MWPIKQAPYYGIFVKEQVEALKKYHPEINNKVYFINGKKSKLNYLWSIFKINWLLTFNKYDVIHIHYALSGLFLLFNPFIKTPVILTLHGSDFNSSKKLITTVVRKIIRKTTDLICLNETMLTNLKSFNKRMQLIPCGVNTDTFQYNAYKRENLTYKIVFPSVKTRTVKNYKFFDKIINNLRSIDKIEIEVIEIDSKTRKEVNEILNEADLLCMTSITEGSPQIIKEALCCRTPIVSSNVGDVKELLSGITNCYVIESYDIDEFSNAIRKILQLPQKHRISNGRSKIYELGLDEKSTSKKIKKLYSSLI